MFLNHMNKGKWFIRVHEWHLSPLKELISITAFLLLLLLVWVLHPRIVQSDPSHLPSPCSHLKEIGRRAKTACRMGGGGFLTTSPSFSSSSLTVTVAG